MPTANYFGRNAFVAFAKEADGSVYGTANTSWDVRRPFVSCSMLRQIEKVPRANLMVAGAAGLRKSHYSAKDAATGSIELEQTYDGCGYFLHELFGASSTTDPGGGAPKVHTYTLADLPAVGVGSSLQRGTTMGLQRGTGQVEVFEGVVFTGGSMSVASGAHMALSMDMIAETSSARTTAITFSEPTNDNLVLHHETTAAGLAWNSQNFDLVDFEFKIENGMAERMRLGSLVTKQPVISDFRSISMTVTFETDDVQGYAEYLADQASDAVVTFNNGASSGDEREISFSLNAAYIESYTDEITETGLVLASVTFRAEGDGSSGLPLGASISVKNEAPTAVHNG
jgi:hypothetical protein